MIYLDVLSSMLALNKDMEDENMVFVMYIY